MTDSDDELERETTQIRLHVEEVNSQLKDLHDDLEKHWSYFASYLKGADWWEVAKFALLALILWRVW